MSRIVALVLATIFMMLIVNPADAENVYYIRNAPGGKVLEHAYKFARVNVEYDRVVIDGLCKSACTMVLGIVPLDKICITPHGYFMFHAAHMANGNRTFNPKGTQNMMNAYAPEVRDWVIAHHALEQVDPYTYLYAKDVRFIRHCRSS